MHHKFLSLPKKLIVAVDLDNTMIHRVINDDGDVIHIRPGLEQFLNFLIAQHDHGDLVYFMFTLGTRPHLDDCMKLPIFREFKQRIPPELMLSRKDALLLPLPGYQPVLVKSIESRRSQITSVFGLHHDSDMVFVDDSALVAALGNCIHVGSWSCDLGYDPELTLSDACATIFSLISPDMLGMNSEFVPGYAVREMLVDPAQKAKYYYFEAMSLDLETIIGEYCDANQFTQAMDELVSFMALYFHLFDHYSEDRSRILALIQNQGWMITISAAESSSSVIDYDDYMTHFFAAFPTGLFDDYQMLRLKSCFLTELESDFNHLRMANDSRQYFFLELMLRTLLILREELVVVGVKNACICEHINQCQDNVLGLVSEVLGDGHLDLGRAREVLMLPTDVDAEQPDTEDDPANQIRLSSIWMMMSMYSLLSMTNRGVLAHLIQKLVRDVSRLFREIDQSFEGRNDDRRGLFCSENKTILFDIGRAMKGQMEVFFHDCYTYIQFDMLAIINEGRLAPDAHVDPPVERHDASNAGTEGEHYLVIVDDGHQQEDSVRTGTWDPHCCCTIL